MKMLINATQPEELRIALLKGQRLYDLNIETTGSAKKKANIYKGRIVHIEPSLGAAFVDYGEERHGFLPLKEVARSLYAEAPSEQDGAERPAITTALREGQELVVQVEKEERANKGAGLTTLVSLAGRYLVLMPNNPRAGGVSRQIGGNDRDQAREALSVLDIAEGTGLILRTAGVGKPVEELQCDLDYLTKLWESIEQIAAERTAPFLIYQESDDAIRILRDYMHDGIEEILVDEAGFYEHAREFVQRVMPNYLDRLKHYQGQESLFVRYQVEGQIESIFSPEVRLTSGGSLVIDHTEALITIDINSARATSGGDIEETALTTNLEAAEEIARQLRIRDLGGLIVIDFIDMAKARNQKQVESCLREAVRMDRARVQIGNISQFGLLEMSRQRLRPSLNETNLELCPRCNGTGRIRALASQALAILRMLEESALKEGSVKVVAHLPVDVATYLTNEKRELLVEIEHNTGVRLMLIPTISLQIPNYRIQRVRRSEQHDTPAASHEWIDNKTNTKSPQMRAYLEGNQPKALVPALKTNLPAASRGGGIRTWFSDLLRDWFPEQRDKDKQQAGSINGRGSKQPQSRRRRRSKGQRGGGEQRAARNRGETGNSNRNRRGGGKEGSSRSRGGKGRGANTTAPSDREGTKARTPGVDFPYGSKD